MESRKRSEKASEKDSIRASVSFPADIYKTLNDIARQKKVSLAWVVREAAEEYIAHKWPLFAKKDL
jgi:metal-responsive CopG/Arc/MetJ family transcriptional regulator